MVYNKHCNRHAGEFNDGDFTCCLRPVMHKKHHVFEHATHHEQHERLLHQCKHTCDVLEQKLNVTQFEQMYPKHENPFKSLDHRSVSQCTGINGFDQSARFRCPCEPNLATVSNENVSVKVSSNGM